MSIHEQSRKCQIGWKAVRYSVCLILFVFTIYFVVENILEYFRADMAVSPKFKYVDSLRLPNLMICTNEPLDPAMLSKDGASDELISYLQMPADEMSSIYSLQQLAAVEMELKAFMSRKGFNDTKYLYDHYMFDCDEVFTFFGFQYGSISLDLCNTSMRASSHFIYPMCFFFENLPSQTFFSAFGGLVINVQRTEVPANISIRRYIAPKVALAVYDPDSMFPQRVDIETFHYGFDLRVRLSQVKITRKKRYAWPKEKGLCQDLLPDGSNTNCEYTCFAKVAYNECGCIIQGLGWTLPNVTASTCLTLDKACILSDEKSTAFGENVTACKQENCVPLCKEVIYKQSISYGKISGYEWSNFMSIKMGFSVLGYDIQTEADPYTFDKLVANIGGQLGLWIGLSFLSIFEIFWKICQPKTT